ncbi:MAG: AAA family ATPase, partial [Planctomycetia bacterium]
MRLLSITVKNFRMHGELSVAFDGSRTLVAGPNESGKSTLMEAIERVLFYPHRSEKGLEEIRPRVGGGPPEVILRFQRNGHACTLRKVFRGAQGTAELTDETDGRKYSGDEAETELRSLLALGEGPLRQPIHGWSHLWVSQGESVENPTVKESLDKAQFDRLVTRLQSLTGTAVMESAADSATYRRIADEHD